MKLGVSKTGAFVGLLAGIAVATGGAWKDVPYEGFSTKKFLRSPVIGLVAGAILGHYFKNVNPILLFFAVIGAERAVTESYKIIRAQKPMKFDYGEYGIPKGQSAMRTTARKEAYPASTTGATDLGYYNDDPTYS